MLLIAYYRHFSLLFFLARCNVAPSPCTFTILMSSRRHIFAYVSIPCVRIVLEIFVSLDQKCGKKEERRCRVCVFIRHEREVTFQWASKMKWICRLWGFSAKGIESAQKNHQVNYVKLLVKNKNVMNSNNVNGRSNLIWNWTNWTTIVLPNHTSLGFIVNISTHKLKQTNSQIYCKCWLWMASWHWSLTIQQTWTAIATNWVRLRSSL